jgi:hypothetical protein
LAFAMPAALTAPSPESGKFETSAVSLGAGSTAGSRTPRGWQGDVVKVALMAATKHDKA